MKKRIRNLLITTLSLAAVAAVPLGLVACGASNAAKIQTVAPASTTAALPLMHVRDSPDLPTATPPGAAVGYTWATVPAYVASDGKTKVDVATVNAAPLNTKYFAVYTANLDQEQYEAAQKSYDYIVPFYTVTDTSIQFTAHDPVVSPTTDSYAKGDAVPAPSDLPSKEAAYLDWEAPVYRSAEGTILTVAQVQALAEGETFDVIYTALVDSSKYYGDSYTFTKHFIVVAAISYDERSDTASVPYGEEPPTPPAITNYGAPVIQGSLTTYTKNTPVGSNGKVAVYTYPSQTQGGKSVRLTRALTVTKATAPTDYDHAVYGNTPFSSFGTNLPFTALSFVQGSTAPSVPVDATGAPLAAPRGFKGWNATVTYQQSANPVSTSSLIPFVGGTGTTALPRLPNAPLSPPAGYGAFGSPVYRVTYIYAADKTGKFTVGQIITDADAKDLNYNDKSGTKFAIVYTALPASGYMGDPFVYQVQFRAQASSTTAPLNAVNDPLDAAAVSALLAGSYFTATYTAQSDDANYDFASSLTFVYTIYYRIDAAPAPASS